MKKTGKAVNWLFEEVLHQSTPAPSASAFVPFLIQLVALKKQPARWQLLALLGDLACGGDVHSSPSAPRHHHSGGPRSGIG